MEIKWTTLALLSFEAEIDFILEKWNPQEASNFVKLVDDFTIQLRQNPFIGKPASKNEFRAFVLSRQTTVFYQVFEDKKRIDLQLFWNNLRDPNDLKSLL
jgi:plasmid stabilization system protein ParE